MPTRVRFADAATSVTRTSPFVGADPAGKDGKRYILARAKFDRRLSVRSASASLLVLLSVLIAQGQMNNPHATPADRAAGSKIFRSHCASCHGVKGTGGAGPSPLARSLFPRRFESHTFPTHTQGH